MKKIVSLFVLVFILFVSGCAINTNTSIKMTLNPSVDTIEINSVYLDKKAKAYFGVLSLEVIVKSSNLDVTQLGEYTIVYEAAYSDLTATIKRIVTVVDETPPVITLNPGIDTIKVGQEWTDTFVTASDNSLQTITISKEGSVNHLLIGEYVITYFAIDASNNTSSIVRIVHVIE
jgi:hypothetical protein